MISTVKIVAKQIPREQLIKGRWYLGRGRRSNVGYWDGQYFNTFGHNTPQFGGVTHKQEGYYTADDGCFQPFLLLDEGTVAEAADPGAKPFSWGLHYAQVMQFQWTGEVAPEQITKPS